LCLDRGRVNSQFRFLEFFHPLQLQASNCISIRLGVDYQKSSVASYNRCKNNIPLFGKETYWIVILLDWSQPKGLLLLEESPDARSCVVDPNLEKVR
jgi:hypothetical protein